MTIATEVTEFCQNNSKMAWILLGVLALLFLIYIYMPCIFDCFALENIWGFLNKVWKWLVNLWDSFFGEGCEDQTDECGCGQTHSLQQGCDGDSNQGNCGGSGSSGGSEGQLRYVSGDGNIVVNLPAINVTVNGTSSDENHPPQIPLPPIVIPSITVPPIYPQLGYQSSNSCARNLGPAADDCEIIDSVILCGKRYVITYLHGIIRVYDSTGSNILQTVTHNLGLLRSIRYENDKFVVEDANSIEYAGVINNGTINFTLYP